MSTLSGVVITRASAINCSDFFSTSRNYKCSHNHHLEHANDIENISDAAKWGWRLTATATLEGPEISVGTAVVVNTNQQAEPAKRGVVGTVVELLDRSGGLKLKNIAVKWRGSDTTQILRYGAGAYDVRPLFAQTDPGSVLVPGDQAVLSVTSATEDDVLTRIQAIHSTYTAESLAKMMNMNAGCVSGTPLTENDQMAFVDVSPSGTSTDCKYPFNSYYKVCFLCYRAKLR